MKKRKRVIELEETNRFSLIYDALIDQLESKGICTDYNKDQVSDYMSFWVAKELLIEDVNKRGVIVNYNNGGGQKGKKKNESVAELTKVNTQMLKILDSLGLRPVNIITFKGDEDEKL